MLYTRVIKILSFPYNLCWRKTYRCQVKIMEKINEDFSMTIGPFLTKNYIDKTSLG